jgi:hypothetical protein
MLTRSHRIPFTDSPRLQRKSPITSSEREVQKPPPLTRFPPKAVPSASREMPEALSPTPCLPPSPRPLFAGLSRSLRPASAPRLLLRLPCRCGVRVCMAMLNDPPLICSEDPEHEVDVDVSSADAIEDRVREESSRGFDVSYAVPASLGIGILCLLRISLR